MIGSFASGMTEKKNNVKKSLASAMGAASKFNYNLRDACDGQGNFEGRLALAKAFAAMGAKGSSIGGVRNVKLPFGVRTDKVKGSGKKSPAPELAH
jgi:hypothetical protein|tara:strand:+ start:225 stop:512 length:288 start_codon:yes stop_codon:yes gene_type:complete